MTTSNLPLRTHYDAVIGGGGHNGLVAAAYLAGAGQSVLVLERNADLGGAATSRAIFPGMDAYLSRYAYLVSLLPEKIVRDLNLPFDSRRRAIASCTPYWRNGHPDALLLSNVDPDQSRESFLRLTSEGDWRGYRELLQLEAVLARKIWPSLLEPLRSRDGWLASFHDPVELRAWDGLVERPIGERIERLIANEVVRGLVLTDAKIGVYTHAHDQSLLQNRCFLLHTIGRGTGEWQVPVGGMGALSAALAESARSRGAELLTRAAVRSIDRGVARHTVTFRQDDAERAVEATHVLVNAGPQVLAQLLGETYEPSPLDEGSVAKVNMLLHRLPALKSGVDPRLAFGGTFHVGESYAELATSYRQAATRLPDRPPFEIYCHTLTDDSILGPDLRAAGYHTLTLFGLDVPYRLFDEDNGALRAELLRRYLGGLNTVLSEPIEDCLARDSAGNPCIEIMTPRDLERELTLNQGNIFHGELAWFYADEHHIAGSWGVETPYERVYLCGASAARGGGVSGIPGHNAAQCILATLGAH